MLKGLEELKAYQQKMLDSANTAEATTEAEKLAEVIEFIWTRIVGL